MAGESDICNLLRTMSPELRPGEFVFCSFAEAKYGDHSELLPIVSVSEREGLTLVLPIATANDHKLEYESSFACVSLGVHSSLSAVGLTAAVSKVLTDCGISSNVVAGYFHDHVFVDFASAQAALSALSELAGDSEPAR